MLFVRGEDDPQIPGKVRAGMRPYVVQAILAGMNYCRDGVFCDEKGQDCRREVPTERR